MRGRETSAGGKAPTLGPLHERMSGSLAGGTAYISDAEGIMIEKGYELLGGGVVGTW